MKIGIIGIGVVGKAIANTMQKEFQLVRFDKYGEFDDFDDLFNCDFIFISVPTPFDCNSNSVDDSAIIESLSLLKDKNYENIVIIKSTIPPGKSREYIDNFNLKIVFNPEFLRESMTPNEDFENQDCVVIGTEDGNLFVTVKSMYEEVLNEGTKYYSLRTIEAEMVKYAQNTMLASRVAIANMIFDACDSKGINYDIIKEIAFDSFEILGPHMVKVPGPDGRRGFGGKCLPKDIRGFSTIHESKLLMEIIRYNDTLRNDLDKFLENYIKE